MSRIGIDLVDVAEFRQEFLPRRDFLQRAYTQGELTYSQSAADPAQSLASRWAAKEAVIKAFGTGWTNGIEPRDIEVVIDSLGAPSIRLHAAAADFHARLGSPAIALSISHLPNLAVAAASMCNEKT